MKIYIVGSVASGKTTLAKRMSSALNIDWFPLDGVVHVKDNSNKQWGNSRRSDDEIKHMFDDIINKPNWVIEEAGRKIFSEGFKKADIILLLDPSKFTRRKRIITRYIKQKLGFEESIYRPSFRMLRFLFEAANKYDNGIDDIKIRLIKYNRKTTILTSKGEINRFIDAIAENKLPLQAVTSSDGHGA